MIFSSIEQGRTAREVERQIEALVLEGVLRAGDRLPGERELSKALNVSRPILREALSSLEESKLLVTRHGEGTVVADVIGTIFAPPIVDLISANAKAKADYLEYRREIEGTTAAMAAERATSEDRAMLARIMNDMKAAHEAQNSEQEAELDVEFHTAICECAHNIILLHTLRSCYRLLADDVFHNRALIYEASGSRQHLFDQHVAIYEAVLASDRAAAEKAARDHIVYVERTTREVERQSEWKTISALRLAQRDEQDAGRNRRASRKQNG
ncbi:MAG: FadR/GntR family transcriptional regulator [Pseudomonadota bacterium]